MSGFRREAEADRGRAGQAEPDAGEIVLDERGHLCPAPVLALGRAMRSSPAGSRISLLSDDPVAVTDVPVWCSLVGANLLGISREEDHGVRVFTIELPAK